MVYGRLGIKMVEKAQKEIDRGLDKLTDKIKDEKVKDAVDGILNNFFN
mgnify:CR=1 FL=1